MRTAVRVPRSTSSQYGATGKTKTQEGEPERSTKPQMPKRPARRWPVHCALVNLGAGSLSLPLRSLLPAVI